MRGGASLRRAVAASIGAHVLIAVALVVLLRWHAARVPEGARTALDTRVDVKLSRVPEDALPPNEISPAAVVSEPPQPPTPPAPETPPLARAVPMPRTLPSEMLALLKRPQPVSDAVESPIVPKIRPATAWAASGTPVHGPLAAGKSIVYVLDASGSMGESGKFDAARQAIAATLRQQPDTVRFQIVVYAGSARLAIPGSGCIPASDQTVATTIDALRALPAPAGRSDHAAGLRAALGLQPDIVLVFTDAEDLPAGVVRALVRQAAKPATVCVAKVTAGGVGTPAEVK